jgi:hypothetical protein
MAIDTSLVDAAKPIFEVGIITNAGTFYEPHGETYFEKNLPEPGGFGAALMRTTYRSDNGGLVYYYVQGRGWEGWVDWRYFETTGMPISGEINTARLNVRSEPSAKSEAAGQVVEGDRIFIYERSEKKETIGGDSGYWYRIGEGEWVFGAYVDLSTVYDMFWVLGRFGSPNQIDPKAVEVIVNGIINAPPRPFAFRDNYEIPADEKNATYQSQVLYWAAQSLLENNGDNSAEWAAFYAEQLGKYYEGNNVYSKGALGFENPAGAEAACLQLEAYGVLGDIESFERVVLRAFPQYGETECFSGSDNDEGNFHYGSIILSIVSEAVNNWDTATSSELLFELSSIAPNRLLKATAELEAGRILISSSDEAYIAEGQNVLWSIIEEYPDEEYTSSDITRNIGQFALVEYLRSLPDDDRRLSFLKKYSGDATPFPIRYQALYLLAYGDEGYDANTTFGPLDTGYRELYDSIQLEDKDYWFTP